MLNQSKKLLSCGAEKYGGHCCCNTGYDILYFHRIALQQSSLSGRLVIYHFVGSTSSSSANPILMLQRFTAQVWRRFFALILCADDMCMLQLKIIFRLFYS